MAISLVAVIFVMAGLDPAIHLKNKDSIEE